MIRYTKILLFALNVFSINRAEAQIGAWLPELLFFGDGESDVGFQVHKSWNLTSAQLYYERFRYPENEKSLGYFAKVAIGIRINNKFEDLDNGGEMFSISFQGGLMFITYDGRLMDCTLNTNFNRFFHDFNLPGNNVDFELSIGIRFENDNGFNRIGISYPLGLQFSTSF